MKKWELMSNKTKGIDSFNTFPTYFKILIAITFIIIILFLIPIKVLLASDLDHDKYLKSWKIRDEFTISYIHSVELTEVREIYDVEAKDIILKETYFKSYGAGLPATTPYEFEITPDGFRIFDINEVIETLIYRTGAVRANHKLIIEDNEYSFLSFSKGQTPVHLEVKNISLLEYLTKEGFN